MELTGNHIVLIVLLLIAAFSCKRILTDSNEGFDEGLSTKVDVIFDSLLNDKALIKDGIDQNYHLNKEFNEQTKVVPQKTKYENFEVVYLDFYRDKLQRVFITIDTINVYNEPIIKLVVCEILTTFKVHDKSNISFFSNVKYADYKTNLFVFEGHSLSKEEYSNWRNHYYLAEFDFQTNEYISYPSCTNDYKRQKTINVKCK